MSKPTTMRLLSLVLIASACGGGSGSTDAGAAGSADASTLCTSDCLTPPENGVQIETTGAVIMPGQDIEFCEVVQLPGSSDDTYYVHRFEAKMTPGSHHLIVTAATPGSEQEAELTVGERWECPGGVLGPEYLPVVGSQVPYHDEAFPEGVGRVFRGGQKIIVNYHYFNATDADLDALVQINFHQTTEDEVQHIARSFGFYNVTFSVSAGTQESVFTQCTFDQDVVIGRLTRHTHRWGTDFNVWYAGGDNDGELVFHSAHYEDTDHTFPTPITMAAGSGFRFECAFDNTETYDLSFGLKVTDEMCILFGTWWPPSEAASANDEDCFM